MSPAVTLVLPANSIPEQCYCPLCGTPVSLHGDQVSSPCSHVLYVWTALDEFRHLHPAHRDFIEHSYFLHNQQEETDPFMEIDAALHQDLIWEMESPTQEDPTVYDMVRIGFDFHQGGDGHE
ncbi:MAG: hypothetical protein EA401_12905 [Planctomycetota bacterium]|nr:MAG: hypothetical protein EA401_12905 [Planctomycetota bacterium]